MNERYVGTRDIQAAVRGYETVVLSAIGVPWSGGKGHITCPYPAHDDRDPSWRWHEKKARAYCSCIEGSHSIFDVVMQVEGLDFEAAKIRVAETIGRSDLIREKDGERRQATDARSLLRPTPAERDDELPRAYLAHRLGIEPGDVHMPVTPAVGWRALAYYDPPARRGARPTLVGRFPCAVFGTAAADGRTHAHRIYVAPGGAGKADLGTRPGGRPRDPKKSAKAAEDDNTAGRSVLWGDPAKAAHIVLAEGIETAAAVAHAFRSEITAGEWAVAAAISASGLRAFQPWPATRRVTVAADRDEDKPEGDRGYQAGERAARAFGLAQHERLAVAIALPGAPGEDIDWLDVLRRDGVQAVRAGIEAAAPFVPTPGEIDGARQRATRALELAEIEASYPLPVLDLGALSYQHTKAGRVKVHVYRGKTRDPETGQETEVWTPVATPFGVPARLRHADQADAYGLRVVVQGMDGRSRPVDFDRATLARMGAAEIRAALFAAGLRVEGEGEAIAVQALKAADPAREIAVVSRTGWHALDGSGHRLFVTPGGEVIGALEGCDVELSAAARVAGRVRAGTLEGWRAAVSAAASVAGCPHWTIGILSGFAGAVASAAEMDTCGVNYSGMTTSGKTTSQKLAVSAWTVPKVGRGLLHSMRTTENALEAIAQSSNGTVLALDEMAHVDGRVIGRMIYSIASGLAKARMTADANLRSRRAWTTFAVLSGETSLEEKVRRDGGTWQAGMAVRIPDIDVTGINRAVPQTTLDDIAGIEGNYGHAGPAFVARLIEEGYQNAPELLRERIAQTAEGLAGRDADGARVRAAAPFALLATAGGLAVAFGILPETVDVCGAVTWAWRRFLASSDAAALDPEAQAIGNMRTWIAEKWDVTIKSVDAATDTTGGTGITSRTNNREAWGWYDADTVYLPTYRLAEAAGGALKEIHVAETLEARGLLSRRESAKRRAIRYVPKIGKVQCYALRRDECGRSDAVGTPEYTAHGGDQS